MKFRGQPVSVVKTAKKLLTSELSQCFTSGAGPNATHTLNMYRADVLRLLPEQLDVDDKTTGRRLVNDVDLLNAGFAPPHRDGCRRRATAIRPRKARARRCLSSIATCGRPLTKIVVYDGAYVQPMGVKMTQTLRGFLQSSANPQAKFTHIVGSGGPSKTDRLCISRTAAGRTLFVRRARPAHEPGRRIAAGANPTFNVSNLMAGIGRPAVTWRRSHHRSSITPVLAL